MQRSLITKRIKIIDDKGKTRIDISTDFGSGRIIMEEKISNGVLLTRMSVNGFETNGSIRIKSFKTGKQLIIFGENNNGGIIKINNKTGEDVVVMMADEYGMGSVGAFDRQGKGRTLTPR